MKNKYNQYITYLKQIISNKLTCSKLHANINKKMQFTILTINLTEILQINLRVLKKAS